MKSVILFVTLCATAAVVYGGLDDDIAAILAAGIVGNSMNCAEYGKFCGNGRRCCQYLGYSNMGCVNGMCLQTRCAGQGQRCSYGSHCCYHEGLTCYNPLLGGVCIRSNGKK